MKSIYHYTKGYRLGEIIFGQKIQAIPSSHLNFPQEKLVWLTREETYPLSALPAIPELPETLMKNQLQERQPVDMLNLAGYVGGIWRFEFNSNVHPEIKPWFGSYQRNKMMKTPWGMMLELTARKVGDQVALWAIASGHLSIINSTLQQLTPNGWVDRLSFLKRAGNVIVEEIDGASAQKIAADSYRINQALFG